MFVIREAHTVEIVNFGFLDLGSDVEGLKWKTHSALEGIGLGIDWSWFDLQLGRDWIATGTRNVTGIDWD